MKKYADFAPTQFDSKGLCAERYNIGDFLVLGVSRTRDSGPLDESNFEAAVESLGGESDDVQVHRFGHWGPGWFELILINPANEDKVRIGEEIEGSLEDYPVLDESDLSEREWNTASEYYG